MFRSLSRGHSARRAAAAGLCAVALLVTSACGSSSNDAASGSGSASGSSSSAVNADAQALVQQRLASPTTWKNTAPPIGDIAKAKGATVLFIPISLKIPYFQSVYASMQKAAAHVGITVNSCDGNFSGANISACVNQAMSQKVSAVVLDNIPLGLIGAGAAALKAAGIKVVDAEVNAQPGDADVAYLDTGGPEMISSMADWIAVDSKGAGNVLIVEQADSPLQKAYITNYLQPRFAKVCPGCKTQVIDTSGAQLQNLGSEVSSALLKNPSIQYVASEFDANASYIVSGLKNSGGQHVKLVSVIGNLASLQRVQSGQQVMDAQVSPSFAGWAITDETVRMLTGTPPVQTADAPWRMFDASNIKSVDVSSAGQSNDSLYGGDTYSASYLKLWGVS